MITPEQLRDWAQDADDGEDVALDGETLREIAAYVQFAQKLERIAIDQSVSESKPIDNGSPKIG